MTKKKLVSASAKSFGKTKKKKSTKRDITKAYSKKEFIKKLRRLADALEKDK